jgi:GR25 family glycosyltransferase involved in LPS biosynthesis
MNFLNKFPIYYINLNKRVDRKNHIENLLNSNNMTNFTRIESYDGDKLKTYENLKVINEENNCTSIYQQGCLFSHLKAIKTAYDNSDEFAFIIEDDLNIEYKNKWFYLFSSKYNDNIMTNTPDDWDLLKFHCCYPKYTNILIKRLKKKMNKYQKWDTRSFSTACYLINRKGMKKIIDIFFINNKYVIYSEKDYVADIILYKLLNTYDYTHPTFTVLNDTSNIDTPNCLFNDSNYLIRFFLKRKINT